MAPQTARPPKLAPLAWLGEVREVTQPLSRLRPIWVRESVQRGGPPLPQPTSPHPEVHPYCEFTIGLEGAGIQYIGREHLATRARQVMLLGPGLPHSGELLRYPGRNVTVYFLPILLLDMGPEGDGVALLSRFTAEQSIRQRIVRPPPGLWRQIEAVAGQMLGEFRSGKFGSELRLRSLLVDALVALVRWEEGSGRPSAPSIGPMPWDRVQRALHYLQERHADPIYVREVARAAGMSESRLKAVFRQALGMTCVQYLNTYRVSLAAAMLRARQGSVAEVALAVGFETLSHFNTTFHRLMGVAPTEIVD